MWHFKTVSLYRLKRGAGRECFHSCLSFVCLLPEGVHLTTADLFRLVHFGTASPRTSPTFPHGDPPAHRPNPPQTCSSLLTLGTPLPGPSPLPLGMLKPVHYITHTSLSKRAVGLLLKSLLVDKMVHCTW